MSDDGVRDQLHKTEDAIRSASGQSSHFIASTLCSITARQKKWINQEFGYKIVLWTSIHWTGEGQDRVSFAIASSNGSRRLDYSGARHSSRHDRGDAVRAEPARAKGFKFVTVSELIAMQTPLPPKPSPSPKSIPPKSTSPSPTPHN